MRRALTTGPAARPGPTGGSRAILDRLLAGQPDAGARRAGPAPLARQHLDDVAAATRGGDSYHNFRKVVSR